MAALPSDGKLEGIDETVQGADDKQAGRGGPPRNRRRGSDWELNPEELQIIDTVGHGSTSHVYSAKLGTQLVAVKEVAEVDEGTLLAVRRELQVMTRTDHPHLLRFIGLISLTPPLRLCLEYCAGGTLFDLLHNFWDIPVSWKQRLKILVDVASAMKYLHGFRKQIIHRDLKSLNIFLTQPVVDEKSVPDIKIADFGFARIREQIVGQRQQDWPTLTRGAGSMHWMAPEVYSGTHYHEKADTFSFSIVTYEVICRHMAFEDLDPESAGEQISQGYRPNTDELVPKETPPKLFDLMTRCWDQQPEQRPTFATIHTELLEIQAAVDAGQCGVP
jgi:serine/threonine protein kinase|eukprot:TRINITY_DN68618_c0_g1_i1.p1 TRINITY_DN68618_c0_g1~~TRINITY_DN68618_c0_g1_i1.p1  ORF type:complete len:348 (-),score=62.03 TRINITY_DN68618_c0_g1_i1:290-1282(-)